MRRPFDVYAIVAIILLSLFGVQTVPAQGYDTPLTMQSLNHTALHSAASRGAGGISVGLTNEVSLMFSNPAMLQTLQKIQVSIGAVSQYTYTKQDQLYGGLQTHSAFTLLTQGVTGGISDPDSIIGTPTGSDTVQRPFDSIGPNWSRSKSKTVPLQAFIGVPFTVEGFKVVAGFGVVEYANLNRYYQNNNCFSPSVLSVLNGTIGTGTLNATPYLSQWFQYYQQRDGSIYGYGGAVSVGLFDRLSLGFSGMLLKGTVDDLESRVGRGLMTFYAAYLRLSKNGVTSYTKTGTSEFSGTEFTMSAKYTGRNFEIGVSVKPPTTITRKYASEMRTDSVTTLSRLSHRVDSLHSVWTTSIAGEDNMKLPWRGNIGLSLKVGEKLTVGLGYEVRSYDLAVYTNSAGAGSNPWLSASLWQVGAEFKASDWLTLRAGAHEDNEVYEPLSNAVRGEAVKYAVYSVGFGVGYTNVRLNVAYEYADMKYVDTWSNAASVNREYRSNIVADVAYELPW
jgi:hypothetical protein